MIEDVKDMSAIPLPNVSWKVLLKVLAYLVHHHEHPTLKTEEDSSATKERRLDDVLPWDAAFVKTMIVGTDHQLLFDVILAANYLDIKTLQDLTCKSVAIMIKGKTHKEISDHFGVPQHKRFTDEEIEQIKKENEWTDE